MLTWSKTNAIIPDEPLRWILATLRFYAIVASVGSALAFAVISILAVAPGVLHNKGIVGTGQTDRIEGPGAPGVLHDKGIIGTGRIDRVEGGAGTMVVLIAMCILFGAATYFIGRLYGTQGYIACAFGFAVVWVGLEFLGKLGIFS